MSEPKSTTSNAQDDASSPKYTHSCQKVRDSCRAWMEQGAPGVSRLFVTIHRRAVQALARDIWNQHADSNTTIEWDEEQWHYVPSKDLPQAVRLHRLALYILALDAINFCFWPTHHNTADCNGKSTTATTNLEYEHLASTMARMAQADEPEQLFMATAEGNKLSPLYIFSPSRMANMTVEEMTKLFEQHRTTPTTLLYNISKRCELWNEVGTVLRDQFNGHGMDLPALLLSSDSKKTAPQLVDWIVQHFPGFRDQYYDDGDDDVVDDSDSIPSLYLYKRAQICVADWNAALQLNLEDMDLVTTFADYRVPQLLRHVGVLEYTPRLAEAIDNLQEIEQGCREERIIRAATVVAVDQLVEALKSLQQQQRQQSSTSPSQNSCSDKHTFTAVTVDWHLWQVGERLHQQGALKPHHRTRTTFY